MVSYSLQNPYALASHLVATGAILTLPGVPLIRHAAVDVQWSSDCEAAVLVLQNDLQVRMLHLGFDALAAHSFGVALSRNENVIAVLTSIDRAAVPNPEDYWSLWHDWQKLDPSISERASRRANHKTTRGRMRPPSATAASL